MSYGHLAGGAEKIVAELKYHMTARGHQVLVVSSNHTVDGAIHFSDIEFQDIDGLSRSALCKALLHLWYPASYVCMRNTIAQFNPDIVHFHTVWGLSASAIFAVRDIPSVLTVHGPEVYLASLSGWSIPLTRYRRHDGQSGRLTLIGRCYKFYNRFLARPIYRAAFERRLQSMLGVSAYITGLLRGEGFKVEVDTTVNGIALPESADIVNLDRLLYVGRLEEVKGCEVLIRAMTRIIREHPSVRLDVVGDGTSRHRLEESARLHGVAEHINFCGWLDREAVYQKYRESTVVVIPSIWPEAFSLVCLEALAVGRPVVCSNVGGLPELITNGDTGIIVEPGDPEAIALAVTALLARTDFDQIKRACRRTAQKHDLEGFLDKTESIYNRLLDPVINRQTS